MTNRTIGISNKESNRVPSGPDLIPCLAKFAPWNLRTYIELFRPLDKAMRQMTHNRPTIPAHMLHGAIRYGCIYLSNIVQTIQHEKLKMIQRAQDLNPEAARAAAQSLRRVADFMAIPYTAGGSLTLGLMDDEDLEKNPCWGTSATEYLDKAGLALGRKGEEAWGDPSEPILKLHCQSRGRH